MKKISALALIIMIISLVGCVGSSGNQVSDEELKQEGYVADQQAQLIEDLPAEETAVEISKVDLFIEEYNKVAINPITDVAEIDVTDKESGHYRTEFRLGAFSESYAKTGKIGDIVIDIVCYGWDNEDIRIYIDGIDLEQAKEIVEIASPILDENLSDADIQEVLEYLDENKEANGYYYGDIGMILLGKYEEGYELMLKVE